MFLNHVGKINNDSLVNSFISDICKNDGYEPLPMSSDQDGSSEKDSDNTLENELRLFKESDGDEKSFILPIFGYPISTK